jgi:hypothetical protein
MVDDLTVRRCGEQILESRVNADLSGRDALDWLALGGNEYTQIPSGRPLAQPAALNSPLADKLFVEPSGAQVAQLCSVAFDIDGVRERNAVKSVPGG